MGNIIKFDLDYFPEFLQPEGLEYWKSVKDEYVQKYGNNEHLATQEIVTGLIGSKNILDYINQVGYSKLKDTEKDTSLTKKICAYSDMRVGPHGVISIEERVEDGKKRYEGRKDKAIGTDKFGELADALKRVEIQIFETMTIKPEDITNNLVNERVGDLRNFQIS